METKELLTSLAQLETSLKEIESAKEQVKQTVNAYTILQEQINAYTNSLDSIKTSVEGIVSDLREQRVSLGEEASRLATALEEKTAMLFSRVSESSSDALNTLKSHLDAANELFSKDSTAVAESFKNNTDDELVKLQRSVQTLKECATTLCALDESIKNTLSEIEQVRKEIADLKQALTDSQNAQDTILKTIEESVDSISQKAEKSFSDLSKGLESSKETQITLLNDIKENINQVSNDEKEAFSSITRNLESIKKDCDSSFAKIGVFFKNNSRKVDQLEKENNTIRILLIINILLTIGVMVLFFVK